MLTLPSQHLPQTVTLSWIFHLKQKCLPTKCIVCFQMPVFVTSWLRIFSLQIYKKTQKESLKKEPAHTKSPLPRPWSFQPRGILCSFDLGVFGGLAHSYSYIIKLLLLNLWNKAIQPFLNILNVAGGQLESPLANIKTEFMKQIQAIQNSKCIIMIQRLLKAVFLFFSVKVAKMAFIFRMSNTYV